MGEYYDLIMEPSNNTFSQHFNNCWHKQLNQFPKPYSDAVQLRIGNQLRPKLTCWGAAFNTNCASEIDLGRTSEIASYIEMLHKASIIIDDMIDNDDARHGKKAFHAEFGRDKAVIFALTLLGSGMNGINEVFNNTKSHYKSLSLYSNTIYRMAIGCLEELELDSTSRFDIEKIRKIINYETITLIKNSFLLGYWSNCRENSNVEDVIIKIGENCGYIFQILNDLEPFTSQEKNAAYKGGYNLDINRNRKNIAVSYIYGAATSKEKNILLNVSDADLMSFIIDLYEKYNVKDLICGDARTLEHQTHKLVNELKHSSFYTNCLNDFDMFISDMISICFSKLGE